jgi:hypothetical protein
MFTRILSKISKGKPSSVDDAIDLNVLQQGLEEIKKREAQAEKVLDFLGIPCQHGIPQPTVPATELVKILTDEKKMKVIMSKLRNKAFW